MPSMRSRAAVQIVELALGDESLTLHRGEEKRASSPFPYSGEPPVAPRNTRK
jgi:hypothetical protein